MNYTKIAESVVASAVKKHLNNELKQHCQRAAKAQAANWLRKNTKSINAALAKAVKAQLDKQLDAVVALAAKAISIRAPVKRRGY